MTVRSVTKLFFLAFAGSAVAYSPAYSPPLTKKRLGGVSPSGITVVFLHGLDSSSRTWEQVMPQIASDELPCEALDLRGCGTSPMGFLSEFCLEALVQDVHNALDPNGKIILVGHSFGGRLAMAYAAMHPDRIAALVVEDMDIARRPMRESPVPRMLASAGGEFKRTFSSQQTAVQALMEAGYTNYRIDPLVAEGYIHPLNTGQWYSEVNPDFRRYAYHKILDTDLGHDTWAHLCRQTSFPCHLMVAGRGTICKPESVELMKETMERLQVHEFPTADHRIHISSEYEFWSTLMDIIAAAHGVDSDTYVANRARSVENTMMAGKRRLDDVTAADIARMEQEMEGGYFERDGGFYYGYGRDTWSD